MNRYSTHCGWWRHVASRGVANVDPGNGLMPAAILTYHQGMQVVFARAWFHNRGGWYRLLKWFWQLHSKTKYHISQSSSIDKQYIPLNMHTVFALLCFVVVIHWLIFQYPSGLLHWHCGNLTIAPVPAKQPWWIWINTSFEFIMNVCITTTKQSTTKPCAYFSGTDFFSLRAPK